MATIDPNGVMLVGENPFIRLAESDGAPFSTNASFWRIVTCPKGPGHVLYLKSELTNGRWRLWTDNLAMARWLQATVQGMLDPETADPTIPAVDAVFEKAGDPAYGWSERISTPREDLVLTWYDLGEPLLVHARPHEIPGRRYGVCTVLIPALSARLALDGVEAKGRPFPRDREGHPFSTCALAFNESWTEERGPG